MSEQNKAMDYWQNLANEAKAGRLILDPEIAGIYDAAIREWNAVLEKAAENLAKVSYITGLGDFPCADDLSKLLTNYLGGTSNSVVSTLKLYKDVADKMNETVKLMVARTVQQDQDHRDSYLRIDPS